MESRGLLFIPDISGFTRFVNETDIEHSRLIIQELLELLINSNLMGLVVSEVEGDAILFYKFGEAPASEQIYRQVENMFCEFHKALLVYDQRRFCQCKACISAAGLTLKVITHYGEFTDYTVRNFRKLIGKDVIVAHQLLKNEIPQHEYWLVTQPLFNDVGRKDFTEWMEWQEGVKETGQGTVNFHYTQLGNLKKEIKPEPLKAPDLDNKVKLLSVSQEYETDMITLFHAAGDMNYRDRWQEGVQKVNFVSHFLPRVGMRSRLMIDNRDIEISATGYSYHPDKVSFTETETGSENTVYFELENTGVKRNRLTITIYRARKNFRRILFLLFQKNKLETGYRKSLQNLAKLIREIKILPSTESKR